MLIFLLISSVVSSWHSQNNHTVVFSACLAQEATAKLDGSETWYCDSLCDNLKYVCEGIACMHGVRGVTKVKGARGRNAVARLLLPLCMACSVELWRNSERRLHMDILQ